MTMFAFFVFYFVLKIFFLTIVTLNVTQVRNLFRSGRTLQFYLAMNDNVNVNYGYGQCENYEY